MEHSLEVHLPFLQQALGDFSIVPGEGRRSPDSAGHPRPARDDLA
jgi:AmmeMemoRadiSam system protein B